MSITNRVTLAQFKKMNDSERDAIPVDNLYEIQNEAAACEAAAKDTKRLVGATVLRRCEAAGRAKLKAADKEAGSATFPAGDGLNFSFDAPNKVEWEPATLAGIVTAIRTEGWNVEEYVNISYSVPESKFKAWPSHIRARFLPARVVKPGTVKAEIIESKKK